MKLGSWIAALLVLAGLIVAWRFLPVTDLITSFADWLSGLGFVGLLLFALIYIVLTLGIGPAWALTVGAGAAFGLWGLALVLPSALAAATAAFLVARYLARDRVAKYLKGRVRLQAVDEAVAEHGLKVVLLLRLSPLLPFGAKSYLLGLSRASLPAYVGGTAIGILPGATLYVYLGSIGHMAATGGPQGRAQWVLAAAGLAATVGVVALIHRAASRRLRELGIAFP